DETEREHLLDGGSRVLVEDVLQRLRATARDLLEEVAYIVGDVGHVVGDDVEQPTARARDPLPYPHAVGPREVTAVAQVPHELGEVEDVAPGETPQAVRGIRCDGAAELGDEEVLRLGEVERLDVDALENVVAPQLEPR